MKAQSKCEGCKGDLYLAGALPMIDYPAGVDSDLLFVCYNPNCDRYLIIVMQAPREEVKT
jgi:hypothetical protein